MGACRLATAHALSLDVRLSPPGFGSLDSDFAAPSMATLVVIRLLEGMDSPESPAS